MRSPSNSQLLTASPPRYTTVSMKFLDLYFSSRFTTVKRISRAGRVIAYSPTRRRTCSATSTVRVGNSPRTKKPQAATSGITTSASVRPKRPIRRLITKIWQNSVSTLTAKSIFANSAVRSPEEGISADTM